jgi:4-carboxymuconolactone decarboxylase
MTRLAPLDHASLSDEQKQVFEAIAGRRGVVPPPMQILLRSPELADKAQALGQFLRFRTWLAPRLSELAIMVTARHWGSQYEWAAHKQPSLDAGISEDNLAAIAERRAPSFAETDEQVVYEFAQTILAKHTMPQALYDRAVAVLGEKGIVELIGIIGFYDLIAIVLGVFDVDLPEGRKSELPA